MLERMWRNGNPLALLVGMQTGAATLENSVELPQKIKKRISLRPSNCTSGYSKKMKSPCEEMSAPPSSLQPYNGQDV